MNFVKIGLALLEQIDNGKDLALSDLGGKVPNKGFLLDNPIDYVRIDALSMSKVVEFLHTIKHLVNNDRRVVVSCQVLQGAYQLSVFRKEMNFNNALLFCNNYNNKMLHLETNKVIFVKERN